MKNELPHGFTLRAPTKDDASAVNALICECDIADYGEPDYSVEDVLADWRRDSFELERDAWLIYASDSTLAAYGNAWDTGSHVRFDQTCVHPKYRGRGLEEFLIERAQDYTREIAESKTIQWIVNVDHHDVVERFLQHGFHPTRHDYVMEIVMDEPPPLPQLADNLALRSFVRGQDERAVWACIQEAFRDMRGHTEDLAFEAWWTGFGDHKDWSPELSCVVMDGDEVVAAAMAFYFFNGGWIRQLGVRRPWRKKGSGLAMLHKIFGDFYLRNVKNVGLGVDASSPTGATRLYERAGMKIKNHYARYEKDVTL